MHIRKQPGGGFRGRIFCRRISSAGPSATPEWRPKRASVRLGGAEARSHARVFKPTPAETEAGCLSRVERRGKVGKFRKAHKHPRGPGG